MFVPGYFVPDLSASQLSSFSTLAVCAKYEQEHYPQKKVLHECHPLINILVWLHIHLMQILTDVQDLCFEVDLRWAQSTCSSWMMLVIERYITRRNF